MDTKELTKQLLTGYPLRHRWQNRFHLAVPYGILGSPSGMIESGGLYHLYCPWLPEGEQGESSWLHVGTRDFVRLQQGNAAICSGQQSGWLEGSVYTKEGEVLAFYTRQGQEGRKEQWLAKWQEEERSFVGERLCLAEPPAGYEADFGEPYVFERQEKRYALLGAKRENGAGCLLLYTEKSEGWTFVGEVQTEFGMKGSRWASPSLVSFGNRDVLLFSQTGLAVRQYSYQNKHTAGYAVGRFSLADLSLEHGSLQEADKGFDYYAPRIYQHAGRNILIGRLGMPESESSPEGRYSTLALPRLLTLRDNHVYAKCLPELQELRISGRDEAVEEYGVSALRRTLPEGSEILLDLTFGEASKIRLVLRYGLESLIVVYDKGSQVMIIDRRRFRHGERGVRRFRLYGKEKLQMRIFVDKTAVEFFFQHGEKTASMLVFPAKNILPELDLAADGPIDSLVGHIWALDTLQFNYHV